MRLAVAEGSGRLAQKAATRRKLLDAATRAFIDGSVVTTSVDAVAAAAGVSKATLFFHFGTRIDLLEAVATDLSLRAAKPVWKPARPGLQPFLGAYLSAQRRPEARLLWEISDILTADGRALPDEGYRMVIDVTTDHLAEDGHPPDTARVLAGVLTPALLFVGRRIAFGHAEAGEVQRFRADVDRLLAPYREDVAAAR